jgi:hypothetical protein
LTLSLAEDAHSLLERQQRSWELLRRNRESLGGVQTRTFEFDGFVIRSAFNPARLTSSLAKVDDRSIRQRRCFLCDENRPTEQCGIDCGEGFELFCNPYPIFPEHFTIIHRQHRPQRILESFGTILRLARDLHDRYTTFYNGPQCGASAPDHLHFQAGTRGIMPVEVEYHQVKRPASRQQDGVRVFVSRPDYLRPFISFESDDADSLEAAFGRFYYTFCRLTRRTDEPMMNVLCGFDHGEWNAIVFPRVKHRPSFYFATDHTRMMLSPGTVDLGGMVTIVLEEDFRRLSREHLVQMFGEISVSSETLGKLVSGMSQKAQPVAALRS